MACFWGQSLASTLADTGKHCRWRPLFYVSSQALPQHLDVNHHPLFSICFSPERGFAWINGVCAALLARIIFGIEAERNSAEIESHLSFPQEWASGETQIYLPSFPWPEGVMLREIAA